MPSLVIIMNFMHAVIICIARGVPRLTVIGHKLSALIECLIILLEYTDIDLYLYLTSDSDRAQQAL